MIVEIGRVCKWGNSLCVLLPKVVTQHITWRKGDRISIRPAGEKLVMQRIPLEQMATVRTGEVPTEGR